jgi:hypothetical protein
MRAWDAVGEALRQKSDHDVIETLGTQSSVLFINIITSTLETSSATPSPTS